MLARDCVASIRRWAVRDGIGSLLMARTDELAALDDRTIQFRLKKPFPMLPYALGKISTPICAMMPERLANTDPFKPVSEMVGSGPFRFKADEWVSGSLAVYTKFDRYVAAAGNQHRLDRRRQGRAFRARRMARQPRRRHVGQRDAGRRDGLVGTADRRPAAGAEAHRQDHRWRSRTATARFGFMKMNNLQPPFDNAAIRRALLGAVVQSDYMIAIAGEDHSMWRDGVGIFTPGTDMATDAGMEVLNRPARHGQGARRDQGGRLQQREDRAAGADRSALPQGDGRCRRRDAAGSPA